ncbi:hypothetical protein GCM10025777_10360 [Membranihabitans marinus]
MLYDILRPTTRWVIRGYYRKILVNGMENIPKDKPVLLAVNHPSSFTEPCVLATHLDRELHFLVRGDLVSDKVKWFFKETNQLPIYRFRDGFSNMRQNEKQFSYCFDLLKENGCIAVFCEGSTVHIKRTRPIQKGIARIAFGGIENRDLDDVYIVPVGVNFESSPQPRTVVSVQIGKPISTQDYYSKVEDGEDRAAIRELTHEIGRRMYDLMYNIKQDDRLRVADDILRYRGNDVEMRSYPVAERNNEDFFEAVDECGHEISKMKSSDFDDVKKINREYKKALKKKGLDDRVFKKYRQPFVEYLWLILGFPFALLGGLFLFVPRYIVYTVQNKLNSSAEYVSGLRMAGFLVLIPLFSIIWSIIFYPILGIWTMALWVLIPLFIRLSVIYYDSILDAWYKLRWNTLASDEKSHLIELRKKYLRR